MAKFDKIARDDYDSPWREALAFYLRDFFDFFFPKISKKIDWSRPQTFLDSTLRQMEREAKLGRREADALIRLYQVDGSEAWVLVHIEIQAQPDPDFAHRMFISHYRIYDSFRRPLCSLAILADKSKTWRPKSYTRQHWDTTISLKFPTRKLQDYNTPERLAQLEKSTNPFAHLVAATLYAQQTRPDSPKREQKKSHLVRKLYDLGLSQEEIRHFFKLIDWVLTLSPPLAKVFKNKLMQYEEEKSMPYITSIEQLGIEKGRREGLRDGRQEGLRDGRQEGLRDGRQEVARRMLSMGYTREQVQQATELSEQQLLALEKEQEPG